MAKKGRVVLPFVSRDASLFQRLVNDSGTKALRTYRAPSGPRTAYAVDSWSCLPIAPRLTAGLFPAVGEVPCMVGKKQAVWIRDTEDYCHLCQSRIDGRSFHMGFDRDHIALNAFFCLTALMGRTWSPPHVLADAWQQYNRVARRSINMGIGGRMRATHPEALPDFGPEDSSRIQELRELLLYLATAATPRHVLRDSIYDRAPPGLIGQGEKVFRAAVTEVVTMALPPLGPNIQAALSQKTWGRTNLMLLFDRLKLQEFQNHFGLSVKNDRSDKSAVMRKIVMELSMAPVMEGVDEVGCQLAELALHRLAFESFFQKSAQYQYHVFQIYSGLGSPSPQDLVECDFL